MAVARLALTSFVDGEVRLSDEVELYQRTYTTLLRSSGETALRVLEPSHMAMGSSLHPLAASEELDLGAFLYAVRRLPDGIAGAELVVMGQDVEALTANGIPVDSWQEAEAPARRRRWYDSGSGTLAVLLASTSDVDDLVPTLVAFQIEWNKIRVRMRGSGWPEAPQLPRRSARGVRPRARRQRRRLGAPARRLGRGIRRADAADRPEATVAADPDAGRHAHRLRPTHPALVGSGQRQARRRRADRASLYFVSSNSHSLVNIVTGIARDREPELVAFVEQLDDDDILRQELTAFREGRSEGSWENFLYFVARLYFDERGPEAAAARRAAEQQRGVTHLRSTTALRVPAQVISLGALDPGALDPRLGQVDSEALAASGAVIVNIDYPLGAAAYNILREVAVDRTRLRGVYILGKAATLNADVGDVMISNVVHDEHSGSTYWLDNAFSVGDLAPDLRFGTGLDNQRTVTVKSTFLQNRSYLDFYYREAFTVVEMETGPYCNAVYEIADADRHPTGEAINFSKLPIDLGIIHYASDTPYTQARTLGARGLSYYGMDSTYASSLAIIRRILRLEGALS